MSTEPDWKKMDHRITPEMEKWVVMLCQAGSADNELKLLTRFQKVVNAIYKEARANGIEDACRHLEYVWDGCGSRMPDILSRDLTAARNLK